MGAPSTYHLMIHKIMKIVVRDPWIEKLNQKSLDSSRTGLTPDPLGNILYAPKNGVTLVVIIRHESGKIRVQHFLHSLDCSTSQFPNQFEH